MPKKNPHPGDVVLDPFCGCSGTALAALMEGRKAIAIDGKATTGYTVYSQVFQCPHCLLKVPLCDCVKIEDRAGGVSPLRAP